MIDPGRDIQTTPVLLMLLIASWLLMASFETQAQQQRVEVQLSANRVSVDESVILNVRAYSIDEELNASALSKDFDVTQRSSSRQVTIENGKRTSLVEWVLELAPKRSGALEIPPIIVGSEQSRPITVLVDQPATGASRDMYLEASVDDSDPFVQGQVIYTLRIFQDVRFLEATLHVPEVDGVQMQQLSEEKNYQETVDGRTYVVSEIRYSVFPQQSGAVIIPAITLQAVIAADQNQVPNTRTRTRRIKRRANEVELNVKPRPDGLSGSWWLPAKAVNIQSEWSSPIDAMEVDQPVTRTIHIMATGAGDEQLPELSVPAVDNISIYADKPTATTSNSDRGLISQQTNTWAVIPQVAGELVLPEMEVNWFDTTTGEARVAVLPAETITVVEPVAQASRGSSSAAISQNNAVDEQAVLSNNADDTDAIVESTLDEPMTSTDSTPQEGSAEAALVGNTFSTEAIQAISRWRNLAAALLAGWVLSLLGVWFWMRKRQATLQVDQAEKRTKAESGTLRFQRGAGSRAALEPIKAACDSADVSKISKEVLSWAAMVWPDKTPTNIAAVAKRLESADLAKAFAAIDAQQFRPAGSVKSVAVDQIPALLKRAVDQYQETEISTPESNALPGL